MLGYLLTFIFHLFEYFLLNILYQLFEKFKRHILGYKLPTAQVKQDEFVYVDNHSYCVKIEPRLPAFCPETRHIMRTSAHGATASPCTFIKVKSITDQLIVLIVFLFVYNPLSTKTPGCLPLRALSNKSTARMQIISTSIP